MLRKIFLTCLVLLLSVQSSAFAQKDDGLPEEERIKVAVEIKDSSQHRELDTAQSLKNFLRDKLVEKNLMNVVDSKVIDGDFTAEKKSSGLNFGELMVFDAVELPAASDKPEDFDTDTYKALGADYVIRCEVVALGAKTVEDRTYSLATTIVCGGLTILSYSSHSSRDKTLDRINTGVGVLGLIPVNRVMLNTVVNMQFISVDTGEILWQKNFTGKAPKHRKPREGYNDVVEEAYIESVEDSAKRIAKRVNKYVDKVIIKGQSDKSFQ